MTPGTTSAVALDSGIHYKGNAGIASWEGRHVDDAERFSRFVRETVRPRITDEELSFDDDLRGLASTGMEMEFIEKLLKAAPPPEDWKIGEAFAECALQYDSGREVHWPWNSIRDQRTPRASLPGADLVGFYKEGETVLLLVGEVKTSSDTRTPPNVMTGRSGMTWQLEENATRPDIHLQLLQWLLPRCKSSLLFRELYKKAVQRYLSSDGKELILIGVLIRDTLPNEKDVKNRAKALATKLAAPMRIEILAWYLPVSIREWPRILNEEEP